MNKQIEEMTCKDNCVYGEMCYRRGVRWATSPKECPKFKNNADYHEVSDVISEVLADVMFAVSKIVSEHIESDNSLLEAEVDIIHALTKLKKKYENKKVDNEQTN